MMRFAVTLFVSIVAFAPASAPALAHPVDDVLSHVPSSTSVCIVVRDLAQHATQLRESPFAAWLAQSAVGKQLLASLDMQKEKAGEFELTLKHQFNLTSEQLLRDVFGEAVVFCFTPGPPERALILIKPAKADTATAFLERLGELQKQAGELDALVSETYRKTPYTARRKKDGSAEAYLLRDGILIFASDEASLKSYLDGLADKALPAPVAQSLVKLKATESPVTVWLNPRAFDAAFAEKARRAKLSERASLQSVSAIWSAVEHVAIHANLSDVMHVHVSTILNESKIPALLAGSIPFVPGQTPLWNAIPSDAIVAVAGRFAVAATLSRADAFARQIGEPPPSNQLRKDLGPLFGKDKLTAVLEALGPDWGLWLTAPERTDAWTPDWTFALRVRPDPTGKTDTSKSLWEGVDAAAQLARLAYNSSHADQLEMREETVAGVKVKSLVGDGLPGGMMPTYAIKQGYFVFASNPERIAKFEAPKDDARNASTSPLVRISGTNLRAYLVKHSGKIAEALAAMQSRDVERVKRELNHAIEIIEPVDRVELSATQDGPLTRLTATLVPIKPLKK